MKLVVDASVAVKWFLRKRADEEHIALAAELLDGCATGDVELIQPPHFIAEVCAVLTRLAPESMRDVLQDLMDMKMRVRDDAAVYARAVALSHDLNHHLFDTLYHAVALETKGATLVTADETYLRKATQLGAIRHLADSGSPGTDTGAD